MNFSELKNYFKQSSKSLLGVGPVSKNCVDAAIELTQEHNVPLFIVASRRQIESAQQGGGYVNDWTTESFADYVSAYDKKNLIVLARDHGGPWQNYGEVDSKMNLSQAMASAKASFEVDIDNGFKMIHIDPSVDLEAAPSAEQILERIFELYEHCYAYAQRKNKEVFFEIGSEEQTSRSCESLEFAQFVEKINNFCQKNQMPKPTFVVAQTGTKVLEMENVGSFDARIKKNEDLSDIQKIVNVCNLQGLWLKEHNADYLSDESLKAHPQIGIHSINVAPEFGVVETKALMRLFENFKRDDLRQEFADISYKSERWKKWMKPSSRATDYEKSLICGHYLFASEEFFKIMKKFETSISIDEVNRILKQEVKNSIRRYLRLLGHI